MGIRQRAILLFVRIVQRFLSALPLSWAIAISGGIGRLLAPFFPRDRAISYAQMAYVRASNTGLSPGFINALSAPKTLHQEMFRHVGIALGEAFVLKQFLKEIDTYILGTGQGHVDKLIAARSGAIALSGHIGCFELLAAYHIKHGVPLSVVARQPNYPAITTVLTSLREGYQLDTIWREDRNGARRVVTALKSGRIVAALIDQDTMLDSAFVPFFGLPAAYPIAMIQIAMRLKVPLLSSFIVRHAPMRHEVITAPIEYDPHDENVVVNVLKVFNARLEGLIAEYPEQWIWWHRRWRRRPPVLPGQDPGRLSSTKEYLEWLGTQTGEPR